MEHLFNNSSILAWLRYYAENTQVDLQKVKIIDITRKNKNLIPTVESHSEVLVFTEAGHADIFSGTMKAPTPAVPFCPGL